MNSTESAKILVVDDEPMIIDFYNTVLGEQGYQMAAAGGGRQALEQAVSFQPDVILLDVVMPDLTGFEVTERLKSDPVTAGIPIIMVTGLGSVEDRVKGLDTGADDFLCKPFNLEELLVRVRSLARLKKLQDRLKPAASAMPDAPAMPSAPAMPAVQSAGQPGLASCRLRPVILVVDDDEQYVNFCETVLKPGGYQIISAPGSSVMFEVIERVMPDMIILDLLLPGMDGVEILSKIKEMPQARNVPIVVLTALDDIRIKVKTLYLGADDYLVKPVNSLELLARVRANFRKHECRNESNRPAAGA